MSRPPALGSSIEGYVIERELGRGGMGTVYEVRDDRGARFAMKLLERAHEMSPEIADQRLAREANVSRVVRHPGIVAVHAHGTLEANLRYLVMDLLIGRDLEAYIEAQRPTVFEYVGLVREALGALSAAHSVVNIDGTPHPVVHRDVKPANIFVLDAPSNGSRVRVVDFGLVRQSGAQSVTKQHAGFGTLAYMAPEQLSEARDATPAADVWSAAVMFYEAVSSTQPFLTNDIRSTMGRILTGHPTRLDVIDRDCPPAFAELVDRCLSPEAHLRPPNAGALAALLDTVIADPRFEPWASQRRVVAPGADRAAHELATRSIGSAPPASPHAATDPAEYASPDAPSARTTTRPRDQAGPAADPHEGSAAEAAGPSDHDASDSFDPLDESPPSRVRTESASTRAAGGAQAAATTRPSAAEAADGAPRSALRTLGLVVTMGAFGYAVVKFLLGALLAP